MQGSSDETNMIRYECLACDMAATCVATMSSMLAWHDHMATHPDATAYKAWKWAVMKLDLGHGHS